MGEHAFEPSNLDKVYWPREGYTKGDMLSFYERIAPYLLPYLKDRPMVMKRYPDGIEGLKFFQKDVKGKVPPFARRITIPAETIKKNVHYIVCDNKETLAYLADLGTVELHPWNSRAGALHHPDFMIFDLDPGAGTSFDDVIEAAHATRELLARCGIDESCVKTSGKRGLHVYVPLSARYTYDAVRRFARRFAERMAREAPDTFVAKRGEENRKQKVFVDYLRNSVGQTAVAPYSLRAAPGATVSTPLSWDEVKQGLDPAAFTMKTIFARLEQKGDLWKPVLGRGADLESAAKRLAAQ